MPYSQTHLLTAGALLAAPDAPPALLDEAAQAAFYFGAIAPDARVVSGQPRESTHFFTIPFSDDQPAYLNLVRTWPALAAPEALSAERAAFIAGYMTHLIMDQTWVEQVVLPCLFIDDAEWGPEHANWGIYNLLMAYLEFEAVDSLPGQVGDLLHQTRSRRWVPFIKDVPLNQWRGHIAGFINAQPNGVLKLLARGSGMPVEELRALVNSPERMQEAAFCVAPLERLEAFRTLTAARCAEAVRAYLGGELA